MKRRWIAFSAVTAVGLLACTYFLPDRGVAEAAATSNDFNSWTPTPVVLRQEAGANGTDPQTQAGEAVRQHFAELFKNRYRRHDPSVAVGMRFTKNTIRLLCPARMEPWNMDHIAVAAWHESQAAFGHAFDIDIYITYIGGPPTKVGELRTDPNHPDKVIINYTSENILGACAMQVGDRGSGFGIREMPEFGIRESKNGEEWEME